MGSAATRAMNSPWSGVALIAFALLFPFIEQALGLGMMNPVLRIMTSIMLALGLNIVVGFAGLLDLGYVAFWAIGAYVVGWFASGHFAELNVHLFSGLPQTLPGIHVSIWLLFPVALAVTAVFGVILGAPTLRLRGDYLAIVTLGFGEIIPKVFQNGDDIAGHNLTNGTRGISGIDTPSLGGPGVDQMLGMGWGTWGPLNLWPWYYLALALCALSWYVSKQMQWSKLGRAWMAIREDETAAAAMGINLVGTKLWAYGLGASLGGLAGVFHGARIGSIFPTSFQFYISIALLCMVIVGGMGNIWGAILGAICIEGMNFWLLPQLTVWSGAVGLDIDFASWNMLIFGALLVATMLFRPQGFLPDKARVIPLEDDVGPPHPLVDDPHAGHADHYPFALHGPQQHPGGVGTVGHPVLDSGLPDHGRAPDEAEPAGSDAAEPAAQDAALAARTRDEEAWPTRPRFPRFETPRLESARFDTPGGMSPQPGGAGA